MRKKTQKTEGRKLEWDIPMYSTAEAARLVKLSPWRIRRWLKGYDYMYDSILHHQQPVIQRRTASDSNYASFLDLIDLLFVKEFIDVGISLQKIRKALNEAARILGTDHFAKQNFFTDGNNIYLQVQEEGDAILQLLKGEQWVIAPIIKDLAKQIDFDVPTGFAYRWYPMGRKSLVVLDPTVSFGRPSIVGKGVSTANIYDLYVAENNKIDRVSSWMNLSRSEIIEAVRFEQRLAA